MITFHMALAIYTQSPSAYEALRGFGILQLPGISTLKTFTSFNLENAGINEERLAHARKQYDEMVKEKRASGARVPFSEGILILDEVKVGLKVHYHAKIGKMTSDDLGSLHDVYQTLQPDHRMQETSYILQYLWRCTVSDFDILGPYYTSSGTMKAKFITSTLYIYMIQCSYSICMGLKQKLLCVMEQVPTYHPSRFSLVLGVGHLETSLLGAVQTYMKCRPGSQTPTQMRRCSLSSVPLIRYTCMCIVQ